MASIVGRPLNRLRRSDTYKPLHERWGDVSISAPTDGSWNQFDNPHQSSHRTRGYGPGFVPEHPPRGASHVEEDAVPSARPSRHSHARQSTFSMSTLNPRRLSVRLGPRPKHTAENNVAHEPTAQRDRRTEFAYKPIHKDYATEVAEHVATNDHPSPQFRYIPATPRYAEDVGLPLPSPYASSSASSSSSRSKDSVRVGSDHRRERDRQTVYSDDLNEEDEDEYTAYPSGRSSSRLSRAEYRSSADYSGRRASSLFGGRSSGATSAEKKRYRSSARYLTTDMVPDADEMYG
ncbi:uncharacterized protein LDX57_006257 [Aspergillus melleus]|uniref:uncharacterized protein n=1 Tax=Aspergillus melleus TaxID=138277 RepID=UPI001E8D877D|nr:uncharacterized protein LDX57_006257 [Aspergillus melleus]KAH8428561.1 hypothetical protein LDX57_006257 [Aspergillus melleus]